MRAPQKDDAKVVFDLPFVLSFRAKGLRMVYIWVTPAALC